MSGDRRKRLGMAWRLGFMALAVVCVLAGRGRIEAADAAGGALGGAGPELDRVEWFDGSKLRGRVEVLDGDGRLVLAYPEAKEALKLRTKNLSSVELGNRKVDTTLVQSTARMSFVNGDEVPGRLKAFDGESFEFESWLGQSVKVPRNSVRSVAFFHTGLVVLYEGPDSFEGWKQGPGQRAWTYRERAFHANGAGMIGRGVKLPKKSSVQFDLEWSNNLALMVGLYTDSLDRLDYNANSYLLYVATGVVSLQRIQRGMGANHLGQVEIPSMVDQNRVSLEVRTDQGSGNVMLCANGVLVQRWQDQGGFAAEGTGLTFYAQLNESSLKLSNLRVTEWDGNFESEPAATQQSADLAKLANRDRLVGALEGLAGEIMTFRTAAGPMKLPVKRVNQVVLNSPASSPFGNAPGMIRFQFNSGARLSLSVSSWKDQLIEGSSPQFGAFKFGLASVRKMSFNLDRPRLESSAVDVDTDPLLQNE